MQLTLQHHGKAYTCDTDRSHSLAITLNFNGQQANYFQTDRATSKPLQLEGFIADTNAGGSCNVDCLTLIPHCNGTHTETVGHIVDDQVWIADAIEQPLLVASLISVSPTVADLSSTTDSYLPKLAKEDKTITLDAIQAAFRTAEVERIKPQALIVRTLPNSQLKKSQAYKDKTMPPFFSIEAIQAIIAAGIEHLLIDLPSVDRMRDDGLLTNHHTFWNVRPGTRQLSAETATRKTITEMIFVDDSIQDGTYLLSLQVPAFASDAAPSRPVIFDLV